MTPAGVYEIRNTLNGKVYIGSSVNVGRRLAAHRQALARGNHSSRHLQAAWARHGADAFSFRKLLICAPDNLVLYEQLLVDGCNALDPASGYNKRTVVQSNAGMKLTEEHKCKIAASVPRGEAHQYFGKRLSEAAYKAAADLKRANGLSPEWRASLSSSRKGKKKPEGFGEKISALKQGAKHTEATRANMSRARAGRPQTAAQKESRGKLSFEKAAEIRALHAATGMSHEVIASQYGVARSQISTLLRGESWVS